jgi:hypothetical protein
VIWCRLARCNTYKAIVLEKPLTIFFINILDNYEIDSTSSLEMYISYTSLHKVLPQKNETLDLLTAPLKIFFLMVQQKGQF